MKYLILPLLPLVVAACVQNKSGNVSEVSPKSASSTFSEGDERGNGADITQASDSSAWFARSNRTIQICYEVAPQFGVSTARIETTIKGAFAKWEEYIAAKGVMKLARSSKEAWGLSSQVSVNKSCAGNEDLVFKFGILDADVTQAMSGRKNPVALSVRTKYDPVARWGAGFVWVASSGSLGSDPGYFGFGMDGTKDFPNWTVQDSLEGLVLHEVGHILGNEHVAGTIMDANISHHLMGQPLTSSYSISLKTVDSFYQLMSWRLCDCKAEGVLGIDQDAFNPDRSNPAAPPLKHLDTTAQNFLLLTGRASIGKISAQLVFDKETVLSLVVSDSVGTYDFPIEEKKGLGKTSSSGPSLFRIFSASEFGGGGYVGNISGRLSTEVTLTTKLGLKLDGRVDENMAGEFEKDGFKYNLPGLTNLIVENGGEKQLLFSSKPL